MSSYSQEDSKEVRKLYFESLKKNKNKDQRKMLITRLEWDYFKAQGQDMSRYEVLKNNLKRIRSTYFKEHQERLRHLSAINKK